MSESEFVLDLASNPHPAMLATAKRLLQERRDATIRWDSYRMAMADATGCSPMEIEEWVLSK